MLEICIEAELVYSLILTKEQVDGFPISAAVFPLCFRENDNHMGPEFDSRTGLSTYLTTSTMFALGGRAITRDYVYLGAIYHEIESYRYHYDSTCSFVRIQEFYLCT